MILRELTEGFVPEKVLHRDEQLERIRKVFENFKKLGLGSNILIQGFSGSGKTVTVKRVLQEYNGDCVFVSGAQANTAFKLIRSIFDVNSVTIERALSEGIMKFQKNPRVIIIDEINKLKNGTELRVLFDLLNTFYRETECPIILITNKRGIVGLMPDDARLTLMFEKIEFEPYNALQLKDILFERLKSVQEKNPNLDVPDGRIEYICALANKDMQSSARAALRIIKRCLLNNDFSDKTIKNAVDGLREEDWREFWNRFSITQKKLLSLLVEIMAFPKKIPYSDVLKHYSSKYDPSTVSKLVDSVEETYIIVSEHENKGRAGGNKRFIHFNTKNHFEKVKEFLEEDNVYSD